MAEVPSQLANGSLETRDLTGTTVGRFQIRARLGAGGMGEVYRAEDTVLKRAVALKRMAPRLREDPTSRKRFLHEAERASRLNDPHIAGLYDVLQENGELFLVMEYIEGETLRRRLNQPMALGTFLDLAVQCAQALSAAHERKILHHDIKPENIMLSDTGQAKILDFGVAKEILRLEESPTVSGVSSRSAAFSGTLAYMAPEVLMEEEADGRSDIFSLGVVFYETLTGRHPFQAEGVMATADRIRHDEPPPVSKFLPTAPAGMQHILDKMLAKKREDRYATAADLVVDLRAVQRGATVAAPVASLKRTGWRFLRRGVVVGVLAVAAVLIITSLQPAVQRRVRSWLGTATLPEAKQLAVLPFETIGGDARSQAFCDGLVATLSTKLTQLTERNTLQVVSVSEVRAVRATSAEQVRQQFGVNLVLTGSVHVAGDQVRVNYALEDPVTRRNIQAGTVDAALTNTFELENRVVRGVLDMLDVELRPNEQRVFAAYGTQSASAYDYYLQGRGYLENFDRPENIENAIKVFEQALRLDSKYALAYTGLGEAYWRKYELNNDPQWVPRAQQACESASRLEKNLAPARICLGMVLNGTGRREQALAEWNRALELEPTSDAAYRGLAKAYQELGRVKEAEETYKRAIALRPYYWAGYNWLGGLYFSQQRYDEAERMFAQVVKLVPDSFRGYSNLSGVHVYQGRYADAITACERSIAIRPTFAAYSNRGTAYFNLRRFAEAAHDYEEASKLNDKSFTVWWNLGEAYYWVPGKRPQSAGAYRRAIALGEELLGVNPRDPDLLGTLAECHAKLGEEKTAFDLLNRALELAPNQPEIRFRAAVVEAQLGKTDRALASLERALTAGYSPNRVRDDPVFDPLRSHPRLQALLREKTK